MRVVIFNYTTTVTLGGVEIFCWGLAHALRLQGIDVAIVGGPGAIRDPSFAGPVVKASAVPRRWIPWIPGTSALGDYRKLVERLTFGVAAWRKVAALRPDVLHVMKSFDLPIAAVMRRRLGCRLVMTWHGHEDFRGANRFATAIDASVACSRFVAEQVARRYPRPEVVYNGVDTERFRPDGPIAPALAGAPESRMPTILVCGRLVALKGFDVAIRALAACRQREVRLVVVGEGEEGPKLRALAAQCGVGERTLFAGAVPHDELAGYYRAADLVLNTSTVPETFSLTACEALACERPVIATRQGALPETIGEEAGLFVEPNDPEALARVIDSLLVDADRRRRMGAAGRRRVAELFSWEKVAGRYAEICKGTRPPPAFSLPPELLSDRRQP